MHHFRTLAAFITRSP